MKATICIIAIVVAILNISLHNFATKAAGDLWQRLASQEFVLAFLLGSASLIGIFAFYWLAGADMAFGIVLMGSVSIIGGTIYAIFNKKGEIFLSEWINWVLAGLIFVTLLIKFFFIKRS